MSRTREVLLVAAFLVGWLVALGYVGDPAFNPDVPESQQIPLDMREAGE